MQLRIEGLHVLTISMLVIFLGRFLTRHVALRGRYNMPPAATGGLICSLLIALAR